MRYANTIILLIVALIHALPVMGLLGVAHLNKLYGISINDPNLEILMRHRAVLFGIIAGLLTYAAFIPSLHKLGIVVGLVSIIAFLLLAFFTENYNASLAFVVKVDIAALILLLIAACVEFLVQKN